MCEVCNVHLQDWYQVSPLYEACFCVFCLLNVAISFIIVTIRNWLWNPENFKRTNKKRGRSTTVHNLSFCAHTLWLKYVTVTFLLVSSSGANHDLHNHLPPLTMVLCSSSLFYYTLFLGCSLSLLETLLGDCESFERLFDVLCNNRLSCV